MYLLRNVFSNFFLSLINVNLDEELSKYRQYRFEDTVQIQKNVKLSRILN